MPNLTRVVAQKTPVTITTSGQLGNDFGVGALDVLEIDINITSHVAGTSIAFTYSRVNPDGIAYPIWTGTATGAGQITGDIGPGMQTPMNIGETGRLSWVVSGAGPSTVCTYMIQGK